MKENDDFVERRLRKMRERPQMYAYSREAFAGQVMVLLEVLGLDSRTLVHAALGGGAVADILKLTAELDEAWARALVDRALALIQPAEETCAHGTKLTDICEWCEQEAGWLKRIP